MSATVDFARRSALASLAFTLAGCADAPSAPEVRKQIEDQVRSGRDDLILLPAESASVSSIDIGSWEANESFPGDSVRTTWTATVTLREQYGWVLQELMGKRLVMVVANEGDEMQYAGNAFATRFGDAGEWQSGASVDIDEGQEPWKPLWDRVADDSGRAPLFAYPSDTGGVRVRGTAFRPLSQLQPYIVYGSDEHKKLVADLNVQARRAAEAAAERERQAIEAVAERKRLADEAAAKARAEAEYKQRLAAEEARRLADEQRKARVMSFLEPVLDAHGAVIVVDVPTEMSSVILEAQLDEAALTIKGRGVDLREMPFKEFTFDGTVNERGRGALMLKLSNAEAPIALGTPTASGLTGRGVALTVLSEPDRQRIDELISQGKTLQSAFPAEMAIESLDAAAAKARAAELKLSAMPGTAIFRGRNSPPTAAMFASVTASAKVYAWQKESVSLRLSQPATGSGLLIRGARGKTEGLTVVINGVHRVAISEITPEGAAIIALPAGLQVLDLRLEAAAAASSRGVALIN